MKRFFVALNSIQTKSLTMTKEVLREREQLENSIENLQKQVKVGLAKLEEIKQTTKKLKVHEAKIVILKLTPSLFWGKSQVERLKDLTKDKAPLQSLIETLNTEYATVQAEVVKLMDRPAKCLNRLREIALKPNPLSTPEYIDTLIEGEESEAKPGWKQRVQSLMAMRENAECMAKLERGEMLL